MGHLSQTLYRLRPFFTVLGSLIYIRFVSCSTAASVPPPRLVWTYDDSSLISDFCSPIFKSDDVFAGSCALIVIIDIHVWRLWDQYTIKMKTRKCISIHTELLVVVQWDDYLVAWQLKTSTKKPTSSTNGGWFYGRQDGGDTTGHYSAGHELLLCSCLLLIVSVRHFPPHSHLSPTSCKELPSSSTPIINPQVSSGICYRLALHGLISGVNIK